MEQLQFVTEQVQIIVKSQKLRNDKITTPRYTAPQRKENDIKPLQVES